MQLFFELSKEHKILPTHEILGLFLTYNKEIEILDTSKDALVINTSTDNDMIQHIKNRLAYTFSFSDFLFSTTPKKEEIISLINKHPLQQKGSIVVRYRNRSTHINSQEIIQTIAQKYAENRAVDLKKADIEIRVLLTDEKIYIGCLHNHIDRTQYEKRKAQHRPYFSPISLHPKLARVLINLAHITSDSKFYDPFCGTGGFLIEAGLIGCDIYGSDLEEKMVQGTKENLNHFHIKEKQLFRSDIGDIQKKLSCNVDAVVTDFPYGKSTTTNKEALSKLYERSFKSISTILNPEGHVVFGLPDLKLEQTFHTYFDIINIYEIPVHRSLTRYFYHGVVKSP